MSGPGGLRAFLAYPLPPGVGWAHVTGAMLVALFGVQLVTGALLATVYSPSASEAYESVVYIETQVDGGALIRGAHHWAASLFLPLAVVHMAHAFWTAAYKKPRRLVWVSGCVLLMCLVGFGFTGYLLPWDLKAFFGTRVGVEIAGSTPVGGEALKRLMAGGEGVGPLTLPRFYAMHAVILPLVTTLAILGHLVLMRSAGIAPSWRAEEGARSGQLFHPNQTFRDAVACLLLVGLVMGLAWKLGAPLGERADPQDTTFVPRPEWYFLGLQQLLRLFQGEHEVIGAFWIPAIGTALLFLLPWLDLSKSRRPRERWLALPLGALALLSAVVLTVWGALELRAEEEAMATRVASREAEEAAAQADVDAPEPVDDAALQRLGARLYRELACDACHAEDAPARLFGAPTLDLQGVRSTREWNVAYLLEPTRIRRDEGTGDWPSMRMPHYGLTASEAEALAVHLATLVDEERAPAVDWSEPATQAELDRGAALYDELYCESCHVLQGEGEPMGPDLDGIGARRTPAWLEVVIRDPEGVLPGTSMEDNLLEPDEARAIARWLASLE